MRCSPSCDAGGWIGCRGSPIWTKPVASPYSPMREHDSRTSCPSTWGVAFISSALADKVAEAAAAGGFPPGLEQHLLSGGGFGRERGRLRPVGAGPRHDLRAAVRRSPRLPRPPQRGPAPRHHLAREPGAHPFAAGGLPRDRRRQPARSTTSECGTATAPRRCGSTAAERHAEVTASGPRRGWSASPAGSSHCASRARPDI